MQVKGIAECSNGSILQYSRPSLSYHLSLIYILFCLFFERPFYTGFTVRSFDLIVSLWLYITYVGKPPLELNIFVF